MRAVTTDHGQTIHVLARKLVVRRWATEPHCDHVADLARVVGVAKLKLTEAPSECWIVANAAARPAPVGAEKQ